MTTTTRRRMMAEIIPGARTLFRQGVEAGVATPFVWASFEKRRGRLGAHLILFDFEKSLFKGNKSGPILLAHEIDAIEACPPGHFTLTAWLTSREDPTVMHVPIEAPDVEAEALAAGMDDDDDDDED